MKVTRSKKWAGQVKKTLSTQSQRIVDSHIHLAVTGLSGSGKTAFITSLIDLLLNASNCANLPFLSVHQEGRLLGALLDDQKDLSVARFQYEDGKNALMSSPPSWPSSTQSISQMRLKLRFKRKPGLSQLFGQLGTLTLDITDYPGEWLMDLPMLEQTYSQWCETFWSIQKQEMRTELIAAFVSALEQWDTETQINEQDLLAVSRVYTEFLFQLKTYGFGLIQPGRFIMPGELRNAPILSFFPVPLSWFNSFSHKPLIEKLQVRFENYKKKVITPFYTQHFRRFDRQIILLDVLGALSRGKAHFAELETSLTQVMKNFHYGKRSKLAQLFSPKINKLAVAATKADHASVDQQTNINKLVRALLSGSIQRIQYHGVDIEHFVLSSIRGSEPGLVEHNGEKVHVVKGRDADGKSKVLFPGEVPASLPDDDLWREHHFSFPVFSPLDSIAKEGIRHIRMDQVLEYLIGDKLR